MMSSLTSAPPSPLPFRGKAQRRPGLHRRTQHVAGGNLGMPNFSQMNRLRAFARPRGPQKNESHVLDSW